MKIIELDGGRFPCPLSDRFRRHTAEELDAMRRSIHARGVLNPVRLYHDTTLALPDCVLDGEGRLDLAAEAGVRIEPVRMGPMSTEEAYDLALAFNDHRRQDDPEAVRRRRRVLEKRGGVSPSG